MKLLTVLLASLIFAANAEADTRNVILDDPVDSAHNIYDLAQLRATLNRDTGTATVTFQIHGTFSPDPVDYSHGGYLLAYLHTAESNNTCSEISSSYTRGWTSVEFDPPTSSGALWKAAINVRGEYNTSAQTRDATISGDGKELSVTFTDAVLQTADVRCARASSQYRGYSDADTPSGGPTDSIPEGYFDGFAPVPATTTGQIGGIATVGDGQVTATFSASRSGSARSSCPSCNWSVTALSVAATNDCSTYPDGGSVVWESGNQAGDQTISETSAFSVASKAHTVRLCLFLVEGINQRSRIAIQDFAYSPPAPPCPGTDVGTEHLGGLPDFVAWGRSASADITMPDSATATRLSISAAQRGTTPKGFRAFKTSDGFRVIAAPRRGAGNALIALAWKEPYANDSGSAFSVCPRIAKSQIRTGRGRRAHVGAVTERSQFSTARFSIPGPGRCREFAVASMTFKIEGPGGAERVRGKDVCESRWHRSGSNPLFSLRISDGAITMVPKLLRRNHREVFHYEVRIGGRVARRGTVTTRESFSTARKVWVDTDEYWNYCVNEGKKVYAQGGSYYCWRGGGHAGWVKVT